MSLEDLHKTLEDHLQPAPSVFMERYKFKECKQQPGEGIKNYVANLEKLSTFCEQQRRGFSEKKI